MPPRFPFVRGDDRKSRLRVLLLSALCSACAGHRNDAPRPPSTDGIVPLVRAHAHNDYWHDRPLRDALEHGFTSVEADVHLVGDRLLVGHSVLELRPWKTLEALYLEPLSQRVRANGGRVFADGTRFILWIDFKSRGPDSYRALEPLLARHAAMLTRFENGRRVEGAVEVVLTGRRPLPEVRDSEPRFASVDAGLQTLGRAVPADLAPFVSASWKSSFSWRGRGTMPEAEREGLRDLVERIHAEGKRVRFWATPESERLWEELHAAGVDLLNTDELERLARFLRERVGDPR